MEVNKYIGQLLYHHDCVILPDFGGFITNYKPAKIDYINHNFYPPGKDLSFNKNLTTNDGLLINHLATIEKVSFVESKNIVVAFVKKTNDRLNSGETVIFEGIGKFYYDRHSILQFDPDVTSNYLLESYGLTSFHFPGIETPNIDLGKRSSKIKKDIKPVLSKRKVVRRIAIAGPAILLLSLLNFNSGKIYDQFSGLSSVIPIPNILPQEKDVVESSEKTMIVDEEVFDQVPSIVVDEEPVITIIPVQIKKYFIVAGSFEDERNAISLSKKLISDNFASEILLSENGMFRVAFSGYENKNEAVNELRRIRKSIEPNAWMFLH